MVWRPSRTPFTYFSRYHPVSNPQKSQLFLLFAVASGAIQSRDFWVTDGA